MSAFFGFLLFAWLLGFPIAFIVVTRRLFKQRRTYREEQERSADRIKELEGYFKPLEDMYEEIAKVESQYNARTAALAELRSAYAEKKGAYNDLMDQLAICESRMNIAELGLYEPHFDYTDSEQYKNAIKTCRESQKLMAAEKTAVICRINWSLNGSEAKGQTMANRGIRLTLRAFNSECDAAIANARWNNVKVMEKRIRAARAKIDALNESNAIFISEQYEALKLKELYLTHECREKNKAEREEKAELARANREEQRLLQDRERARREEERYRTLLAKARAEAENVVGPKLAAFNEQVRVLEADLAEAQQQLARADAMAERTKSGFVYVISNIGSFGENVVKIGMTRRLDPEERIRELGDASVPFIFDIHAVLYSDDAPALERALHSEFDGSRVNTTNARKEFFRATIDEVEAAVRRVAPTAPFFRDFEAQEYRETLARRTEMLQVRQVNEELPIAV
ncbi:DUF4041 domain-containing protein [Bradyrhizobium retamae]|uniref:Chromosome partitioning protein ParA n=1 Tax=Bradyrhizobium retamae TaxID=1300035 RepID=A0A0R3MVL0_9BRAD|nr:DUF4041 domain-containing protein [Bradyrhizobium retamae]KRR23598.1 chromosome partitioning protein ParA [Bradyrhizobium retamae]